MRLQQREEVVILVLHAVSLERHGTGRGTSGALCTSLPTIAMRLLPESRRLPAELQKGWQRRRQT